MILVDTSIWVRALSGKQPYRNNLDELLVEEAVVGHELVYGELLIGDPGGRSKALAAYALFTFAPTVPHVEVVEFVRARRLHGRGIGWIDAQLLASSMVSRAKLYTVDGALRRLAESFGVAYEHG